MTNDDAYISGGLIGRVLYPGQDRKVVPVRITRLAGRSSRDYCHGEIVSTKNSNKGNDGYHLTKLVLSNSFVIIDGQAHHYRVDENGLLLSGQQEVYMLRRKKTLGYRKPERLEGYKLFLPVPDAREFLSLSAYINSQSMGPGEFRYSSRSALREGSRTKTPQGINDIAIIQKGNANLEFRMTPEEYQERFGLSGQNPTHLVQ